MQCCLCAASFVSAGVTGRVSPSGVNQTSWMPSPVQSTSRIPPSSACRIIPAGTIPDKKSDNRRNPRNSNARKVGDPREFMQSRIDCSHGGYKSEGCDNQYVADDRVTSFPCRATIIGLTRTHAAKPQRPSADIWKAGARAHQQGHSTRVSWEADPRCATCGWLQGGRSAISPHVRQGQLWKAELVLEGQELSVWRFFNKNE
ncbi:MAG: hypothetical protein ACI80I_002364 [Akkermansiaceae bacterium]|jgi:hypothetical protein